MKVRSYLLTFFAYIFFHSLMTAFSFVTPYFRQSYQLSNLFLGVIDCTLYFSKGLGFLLRYKIVKQSKIMKHFLISSTIFILAFILFPFLSIIHFIDLQNIEPILFVLITTYGFFLYNNWAVSLSIVSQYFTTDKDGCLLGLWSAAGDFGSMVGFIFPSILIIQLGWTWEIPLIILSVITFLLCFSVYKFIPIRNDIVQNLSTEDPQKQDQMQWRNFKTYFINFHKRWQNLLFTVILCCYRALTYTFLLWLPSYLDSQGQNSHIAMLSIIFNITTIIGSFTLGKVYEINITKVTNETLVKIVFSIVALIIAAGFIVMIIIPFNVITYSILIAIEGFGIGGLYNTLTCNQILYQVGDSDRELNFFTVVTGGLSNFVVGITMLVIGIYINVNTIDEGKNSQAYENIFKVALAISIIGLIMLLFRAFYLKTEKNQEENQLEEEKQMPKIQNPKN